MHNGLLNLSGEKMSKSTGHVVDLVEGIEKYAPGAVRLFYLRTHYRKPVEFSEESLVDAKASLDRIWAFRRRVPGPVEDSPLESAIAAFKDAMDSDLDNAGALAVLFDLIREGNRRLDDGGDAGAWVAAYDEITGVLGLDEPTVDADEIGGDVLAFAADMGLEGYAGVAVVDALIELRRIAVRAETGRRPIAFVTVWLRQGSYWRTHQMASAGIGDSLEGFHAATAAFDTGRVTHIRVENRRTRRSDYTQLVSDALAAGIPVQRVDSVKDAAVTAAPQGILARARPIRTVPIEEAVKASKPPAVLVLDHLEEPRNIGAIARTMVAAGWKTLVLPERRSAPLGPTAFQGRCWCV